MTEMFAKHLIQIPGFSAEKAEAVIAQFPTPTRSANNLVVAIFLIAAGIKLAKYQLMI